MAKQFAEERSELRKTFKLNAIREETEVLAKLACMLDPDNKIHRANWAEELSVQEKDTRINMIDEIDNYLAELPVPQQAVERKSNFYTRFIGQDEVSKQAETIAKRKKPVLSEGTVLQANSKEITVEKQQNITEYAYVMIEELQKVTHPAERQKKGTDLVCTLYNQQNELEPVEGAGLFVVAAQIADKNPNCAKMAHEYIVTQQPNLRVMESEVIDIINESRELSSKKSPFYTQMALTKKTLQNGDIFNKKSLRAGSQNDKGPSFY